MRRIRLFIASSLDGYIARSSGDIDWLFTDQDYGYDEFFAEIDTVIMGRKTYEQILTFGEYPYSGKQGFVFSKTWQERTDQNVEFVGENLVEFVQNLRQSQGGDIWLIGGGGVIQFFIQHGFLDELILAVHPIILGDGIPLIVKDPSLETKLELKAVKPYQTGLVQLFYDLTKR